MQILQFSGGFDSLACLALLQDEAGLEVLTVSTDGAYPERREYLERVNAAFPHIKFHHAQTDRELEKYGRPVDVVPVRWTALGQLSRGLGGARYQDPFSCCNRGIWGPMDFYTRKRLKATTIIRGQRAADEQRAPLRDGQVVDGITYRFPLENWTRARVEEFVNDKVPSLIPHYYALGELTSRDCIDCTAYLADNMKRIENLPPVVRGPMSELLNRWRDDVLADLGA
jgi:3'-phosphoadenosine 5'-phosphosulfate sulfotransferase (PAPS reductase)/FAD synthetase